MAITNTLGTNTAKIRYGGMIDDAFEGRLVLANDVVFNNDYEGSAKAGSVKVLATADASVSAYNKANGITPSAVKAQYIDIPVNKDYAVMEIFDGFDAMASVGEALVMSRMRKCGYALAKQEDIDGATELFTNGTAMTSTTALTANTVYNTIVDANELLDDADVPAEGRYILVTPNLYGLIKKSGHYTTGRASDLGDDAIQTGEIMWVDGLRVLRSNNLPATTEFIAGHPDAATRVNEWAVPVTEIDTTNSTQFIGAAGVKGRVVYAHKVILPAGVVVKKKTA